MPFSFERFNRNFAFREGDRVLNKTSPNGSVPGVVSDVVSLGPNLTQFSPHRHGAGPQGLWMKRSF